MVRDIRTKVYGSALFSTKSPVRRISLALAAVCGAAFGLGLARTLFEWQPLRLSALANWPGTLLLVAATAALAAVVVWRTPRFNAAHTLPLALPLLHALAPDV